MFELKDSLAYFRGHVVPFTEANLSIASAPVLYGLSVYTVFPVFWNETSKQLYAFRLRDHFNRLQESAKIMDFHEFIEKWDYESFEIAMLTLLTKNRIQEDALVRVSVYVDELMSGTKMHGLRHELSAFVYPQPTMLPIAGARACVSSWMRTPDNAIPSRAKINGSYVNAALMKQEALVNGYDEAIALDSHGHVAEASVANIFIYRNGKLSTPSNATDLLEGITRDTIFALAKEADIACGQRNIDRSELYLADEVFLSGSSVRIAPIVSIDGRLVGDGKPGSLTQKLLKRYDQVARGTDMSAFNDWRTAVAI
jgi:branched-chain amino acid aminotransferase